MAAKIATLVLTFIINIAIGIVVLFFMLLAMNGYSESDATPGLISFIVLSFFISMAMSFAGFFVAGKLIRKDFKPITSALISVPIFCVIGGVLIAISSAIGIGIAEYIRVNY